MPVYYNSNSMKKWKTTNIRKDFNEKNKPIVISDDDNKERETIFDSDSKPVERKPLKADTMDTNEVNAYSIDTNANDMVEKTKWNRPLELSGTYKLMSDRGIHFTSYSETLPESGQTYSWSEHSGSSYSSSSFNKGRRVPGPMREEGDNNNETE